MRRAAFLLLGLFIWLSITCRPALSEEPKHTTAKVLAAWKKRRQAVRTIDYVYLGEKTFAKGTLTEDFRELSGVPIGEFPPQDRVFPVKFRFAARLPERKLRFERQDEYPRVMRDAPPTFGTDFRTKLFDGEKGYDYIPDEHYDAKSSHHRQLAPLSADTVRFMIESKDHPVLLAHGFVPVVTRNTTMDDLAAPAADVPYLLVGSTPDDNGMLVLRSKPIGDHPTYELSVDSKRDYLIARVVMYSRSQTRETTNLKHKASGDDWLLSEWQFIRWGRDGIERSYKMKVKSVKINEELPDELFVPPPMETP